MSDANAPQAISRGVEKIMDDDDATPPTISDASPPPRANVAGRVARTLAVAVPVALAIIVAAAWLLQDRALHPRPRSSATPVGWSRVDLGGGREAYWRPPARPDARTLLLVPGEGMDGDAIARATAGWRDAGYGALAIILPGYAGAEGDPGPATIADAATRGVAWLGRRGATGSRLVIEGVSLGAGGAIRAAAAPHQSLVLISGTASLRATARERYGPFGLLLREDEENEDALRRVAGHVIVVHGATDETVPYAQGERLAKSARVPVITLPGGHDVALDPDLQGQLAVSVERRSTPKRA